MADSESEGSLLLAAEHIINVVRSKRELSGEEKKALADLRTQLLGLSSINPRNQIDSKIKLSDKYEHLDLIEEKIMSWEADQSILWESGRDEIIAYMSAIDDAQNLIEELENDNSSRFGEEKTELMRRTGNVLQTAMCRLEDEFRYLLLKNKCCFEPGPISEEDGASDKASSVFSFGRTSFNDLVGRDSTSRTSMDGAVDLVNPDSIADLRWIAGSMLRSSYGHECSQVFIAVQKDTLQESMLILEMERYSIEDVLKLDWASLYSMIKKWIRVIRIVVRVYFQSERTLIDEIFGDNEIGPICFVEASKVAILQLLNFGEAVSIGPHQPEKLFCILDMYEIMVDLRQEIEEMYSAGPTVRIEYEDVLNRLSESAAVTFLEFKRAIASNSTSTYFASGGVHHLTRYVMNYLNTLTDYHETLELLHKDDNNTAYPNNSFPSSPDMESPRAEEDESNSFKSNHSSQMSRHFHGFASILQMNLSEKSRLYKDMSLQHLFLMNNIHYMAEKVKNSETLRPAFGDEWIRRQNYKFQQHALNYQRTAWGPILSLLKDEGLVNPNSHSISRTLLKERFRSFSVAFEELYKAQTAWLIPDLQLREELRISISSKLSQAYRTFVGRHSGLVGEKHIKYNPDDLDNYILDLFEGVPKLLQNANHRW